MANSLQPHGVLSPWNSAGQNTGVGSLSLLQRIFPTQGSNPGLLHSRWILYQLSYQGSPKKNRTRTKAKLYMVTGFWGLPSPGSLWIKSVHWIYSWVCRSPNKNETVIFFLLLFSSHWVLSWLFCYPMDCSPTGSSVRGIFQARTLEWVAISIITTVAKRKSSSLWSGKVGAQFLSLVPGCHT